MPSFYPAMPEPAEHSSLEIVNPGHARGPFRCVVFDFDGTLSLLRGNWQGLMIPRMVEILRETGTDESVEVLEALVTEFVTRLTGQPTMQQMQALADEVARRGRPRPDPQKHFDEYLERLLARTAARIEALESGQVTLDEMLVPGSRELVERLAERGMLLAISSGTELDHVRSETVLLGLGQLFGSSVYGPANNDPRFSKEQVLRQLIAEHGLTGSQIACIGDGPAEMQAAKAVGGLALGVASDEIDRSGRIHALKREHLIRAGADIIVPDYRNLEGILSLFISRDQTGPGELTVTSPPASPGPGLVPAKSTLASFDRSRLVIKPLAERQHDIEVSQQLPLDQLPPPLPERAMLDIAELGRRMARAKDRGAAILLLMGAHVIRAQVARQLIDLMERGLVTHIGMNGAGPIHDYELARIGATCESVARYIRTGEFGLWRETGEINDIVRDGVAAGLGLGESLGRHILASDYPHKDLSVLAAGVRLGVPVTVHVGIGYDILHEHPNFDPAAFGTGSYRDFLAVCATVDRLEGGVFLCMGSAVMGPEVYLKALSMARNVARQNGRQIAHFTTAAFDLIPIEGTWQAEAPKTNPQYYYRPWKTILVRTVADGGESYYVCGDHRQTVPYLRHAAIKA